MATILSRSLVAGSKGGCERWKTANYARRCGSAVQYPSGLRCTLISYSAGWKRRALAFPILAVGSDIGDPEGLTGDDYDLRYGGSGSGSGSDFEGDSFYLQSSPGSINEKLEAASQLSESVPSSSVDQLDESGGDDDDESPGGRGGGGGGGGSDGGDEASDDKEDKNKKLSASQKLTLAYAVLVAAGGAIGYAKSRSVKSLLSGAISGLVLYIVYTQLPVNPTFASSLGLGVSALLLAVMGARFKKSGKLFPAGVVSFVSLVMTGGYIHGILRSSHA